MKTVELVRALMRGFGAFWLISGIVQTPLAVVMVFGFAFAGRTLPNSPLGFLASCALQMGVFGISSIIIGIVLILTGGPIARFAAKGIQDA